MCSFRLCATKEPCHASFHKFSIFSSSKIFSDFGPMAEGKVDILETENGISGLSLIKSEVEKMKLHKNRYVVFDLQSMDPVKLRAVGVGECANPSDIRATPSPEELHKSFDDCMSLIDPGKPCFIAYDFGYYNNQNSYRSMVLLVSYVPEDINFRIKIAFASNVNFIQSTLDIPHRIQADELSDFSYERLLSTCSSIQRT